MMPDPVDPTDRPTISIRQRLAGWAAGAPTLKFAMLGLTMAVLGTYVSALAPVQGSLWDVVQRLLILGMLAGSLLAGSVVLLIALVASNSKSPTERIATIGFIFLGITLFHALIELGNISREKYLEAMIPILAGILTAWGIAAFLSGSRRRSALAERFAPRPRP